MRRLAWLLTPCVLIGCSTDAKVGKQPDGSSLVATGQILRPAGEQIKFNGRPVDLCLSKDKKTLFVKDNRGLVVIDVASKKVVQELSVKGGTSLKGIGVTDDAVWISGAAGALSRATLKDGKYAWDKTIELPKAEVGGNAYPCGFVISNNWLVVAASRDNAVHIYDVESGEKIERIPVDVAPYDIALSPDMKVAYVSCWSRRAETGKRQALSSGTMVEIDERSVAKGGSVLRLNLESFQIDKRADVDLQPMQLANMPGNKQLLVAHGNADHVSILENETMALLGKIDVKPEAKLPFGSMPGAIAISPNGKTMYSANGGDNAIGVFDIASKKAQGFIPVGWCPGALLVHDGNLWVANIKGDGSQNPRSTDSNLNVHAHQGTISVIPIPGAAELKKYTQTVAECNSRKDSLIALERSAAKPGKAVPEKLGERSPIEHVVYILKENRTYDQVLGDLPQGDGEPKLCIFGKDITPNHHALAEEFVLLDNFYCNGVLSADGHSWAMEGAVTGYLERSFGGFTRSYPYGGDDALNAAQSGFIWDDVLAAGLTFRNFGEFDEAHPSPKRTYAELMEEHKAGKITTTFPKKIEVERMKTYSDPDFPGWNMDIPEQIRADIFLDKLGKMDSFANLTIIYLPQDHTSGNGPAQPTPQACLADNDLALGRIVEALSKSKWWPKMAIFVVEDDPQNGFDHVDGHRSPAFVISPYVKRKSVVSKFYNQTSVLHTMSRILGVRPITQFAALSPLMKECFVEKPDLTPYVCRPALYPIDKLNPPKDQMTAFQRKWADLTLKQDLTLPDSIHDDTMNRIIWHTIKGEQPYPSEWAGAHGRGLKARGLRFDVLGIDEDDD